VLPTPLPPRGTRTTRAGRPKLTIDRF